MRNVKYDLPITLSRQKVGACLGTYKEFVTKKVHRNWVIFVTAITSKIQNILSASNLGLKLYSKWAFSWSSGGNCALYNDNKLKMEYRPIGSTPKFPDKATVFNPSNLRLSQ